MLERGTLYVCPTPIGNLADITLRVLDVLKQADLIAAEDTRHSRKLLDHYDIHTPMISYHEHNEKQRSGELIERMKNGQSIALISDAGMPGISDPGEELIRRCQAESVKIDVLPGANAALVALVLSGMSAQGFAFHGFLPPTSGKRQKKLAEYGRLSLTQIFYEAPHRLIATLQDILSVWGDREGAVVREISKIHQTVSRGQISRIIEEYTAVPPKGECCIVIGPWQQEARSGGIEDWIEAVDDEIAKGLSRQDALKKVAQAFGISKRDVYQAIHGKGKAK